MSPTKQRMVCCSAYRVHARLVTTTTISVSYNGQCVFNPIGLTINPSACAADHHVAVIPHTNPNICFISELAVTVIYRQSSTNPNVRINLDDPQKTRDYVLFPKAIDQPHVEYRDKTHYDRISLAFDELEVVCRKKCHAGRVLGVHILETGRLGMHLIMLFANWNNHNDFCFIRRTMCVLIPSV